VTRTPRCERCAASGDPPKAALHRVVVVVVDLEADAAELIDRLVRARTRALCGEGLQVGQQQRRQDRPLVDRRAEAQQVVPGGRDAGANPVGDQRLDERRQRRVVEVSEALAAYLGIPVDGPYKAEHYKY